MQVNLISVKSTVYDLNETTMTAIPKQTFDILAESSSVEHAENSDFVVAFTNMKEYKTNSHLFDIDDSKPVLVNNKGNVLCQLKNSSNVSADTKKDNGK